MFYTENLTMHKVLMHADEVRKKTLNGLHGIIYSLTLVDNLPVKTHKPYNNLRVTFIGH